MHVIHSKVILQYSVITRLDEAISTKNNHVHHGDTVRVQSCPFRGSLACWIRPPGLPCETSQGFRGRLPQAMLHITDRVLRHFRTTSSVRRDHRSGRFQFPHHLLNSTLWGCVTSAVFLPEFTLTSFKRIGDPVGPHHEHALLNSVHHRPGEQSAGWVRGYTRKFQTEVNRLDGWFEAPRAEEHTVRCCGFRYYRILGASFDWITPYNEKVGNNGTLSIVIIFITYKLFN